MTFFRLLCLLVFLLQIISKSFFFLSAETSETDVQAVLIDCSSVIFVDVAGARLFTQVSLLRQDIVLETSLHGSFPFLHALCLYD